MSDRVRGKSASPDSCSWFPMSRAEINRNFDEINLRVYVRHKSQNEWRRGVVFIKEFVQKKAIAELARALYNEN